jgi:predicted enzyme related to lactoylglutathione lyase
VTYPADMANAIDQTTVVTGVDFVCVPTQDITAAMDFYGDVLGLERSKLWQRGDEEPMGAEFEPGTVTIALLNTEKLGIEFQANNAPIALQVDDVEAARAALESRGVTFVPETMDSGVCHMAYFSDPDGNALMLHHRYAPPGERPKAG